MITFNTQEEFEEAVMAVVRERLAICLRGGHIGVDYGEYCISKLSAELQDKGVPFAGDNT